MAPIPTPRSSGRIHIDRTIAVLAARHDGLVPVAPLIARGHSYRAIEARVQRGVLAWVCRGVLRFASVPLTPARRARAVATVVPGTWISHTTALELHGIDLDSTTERPRHSGDRIEAIAHVSNPNRIRLSNVTAHQVSTPERSDLVLRNGVLVSRPRLAIFEASAVIDERTLALLLDTAVRHGLVTPARVAEVFGRRPRGRGSRVLNELLRERIDGSGLVRSFFEHDLDRLVRRAGFPPPVRNLRIVLPGGSVRILDLAWPELRVALEADSWRHHSSTGDRGRTRVRDRQLAATGWLVVPVVYADIANPRTLVETLNQVLAMRAAS